MKINWIRNSIAIFFLTLFVIAKMGGLHVFSHASEDNHGEDCAICIQVNSINFTPAIAPASQDVEIIKTEYLLKVEILKSYTFVVSNSITSDQLFSRPPPYLL